MNAVDTNLLLYSVDHQESTKQHKAQETLFCLAGEAAILLWQVLRESAQQLRRWLTSAEFTQHIAAIRYLFLLVVPTAEAFDRALNLAERFILSHWDRMILDACQAFGITRLYTEDIGAPREIDGIELINPFA